MSHFLFSFKAEKVKINYSSWLLPVRNIVFLSMIILSIAGCKKTVKLAEDITIIDSTENTLFIDHGRSSIVINNSGDSTKCYDIKSVDYKIIQIAPEGEWTNYIVKQSSSTVTCDGQEGQKRTIVVEIKTVDPPNHNAYIIQHDCDEINLEHDYYETVVYGCCDAEPVHRIYDYKGNLIVEGNARIVTGSIPNNALKFFVSYTPSTEDTMVLGSIHLAYDADRKYQVQIMSPPLPPDMCSQYTPMISLVPANRRDSLEVIEDEYQLWDLEPIASVDEIRNIAIEVQYQCEIYFPVEPIIIPITNGKPFGEDSTLQHVTLVHVTE